MDSHQEDETNWDKDEDLEKRHIAITDNLEDASKYPLDWMNGMELHDLQESCTYASNEYSRKESERRQWIKWLKKEEIKVREEHNRRMAILRAELNERL